MLPIIVIDIKTANSQKQIRDIVESAYDHGAEMIVTPCQLCQANVEVYQSEINKKKGTKLAMPVVYYSQLMSVAYGGNLKQSGLDGHVIQPEKLQQIAERKNNRYLLFHYTARGV
ncbi:MAG: hypothetical protein ACOY9D_10320 [Pseudomonadota bacterium]